MSRLPIAILLVGVGLAGCERTAPVQASGKVFTIAYLGPTNGDDLSNNDDILSGLLAANAADPLLDNGDALKIAYGQHDIDGKVNSSLSINQLKDKDVSALLLGFPSKTMLMRKNEINALGLPSLAVIATHPDVTTDSKYISQLSFDDEQQGQTAALFVRDELLLEKAVVIFDDTNLYSGYLGQVFRTKFETTGGEVIGFYLYSQLTEIMMEELWSQGVQLVYAPLDASKVLSVLDQLDRLGWRPDVMASDGLLADILQDYPDRVSEVNGVFVTDLFTDSNQFVGIGDTARIAGEFHREMFSDELTTETALGVEAYQVIKRAINGCPDRNNGQCVSKELRKIKNYLGVMSLFSFRQNGKVQRPVFINVIKNGRFEMIVKVN